MKSIFEETDFQRGRQLMGERAINITKAPLSRKAYHRNILDIAQRLGPLLIKKDSAYGDATRKTITALSIFFPEGIAPEQYGDVFFMIQVLNKMSRIAEANDPFGEDPWFDISGYAVLAQAQKVGSEEEPSEVKSDDVNKQTREVTNEHSS